MLPSKTGKLFLPYPDASHETRTRKTVGVHFPVLSLANLLLHQASDSQAVHIVAPMLSHNVLDGLRFRWFQSQVEYRQVGLHVLRASGTGQRDHAHVDGGAEDDL